MRHSVSPLDSASADRKDLYCSIVKPKRKSEDSFFTPPAKKGSVTSHASARKGSDSKPAAKAWLGFSQVNMSTPPDWREEKKKLYNEEFPSLGASTPPTAKAKSYADLTSQQPMSYRVETEGGGCKTVSHRKMFRSLGSTSSLSSASSLGLSAYSARLLGDNRMGGFGQWGSVAKDAFFEQYQTKFVDTHCHLDFLFNRLPYK